MIYNPKTTAGLLDAAYKDVLPEGYILLASLPENTGWILEDEDKHVIILIVSNSSEGWENAEQTVGEDPLDCEFGLIVEKFGYLVPGIYGEVGRALDDIDVDNRTFVIVGHSTGAAVAVLLGLCINLSDHYPSIGEVQVDAFACPKIGNHKFIKTLEQSGIILRNFVNTEDTVINLSKQIDFLPLPNPLTFSDKIDSSNLDEVMAYCHSLDVYLKNVEQAFQSTKAIKTVKELQQELIKYRAGIFLKFISAVPVKTPKVILQNVVVILRNSEAVCDMLYINLINVLERYAHGTANAHEVYNSVKSITVGFFDEVLEMSEDEKMDYLFTMDEWYRFLFDIIEAAIKAVLSINPTFQERLKVQNAVKIDEYIVKLLDIYIEAIINDSVNELPKLVFSKT